MRECHPFNMNRSSLQPVVVKERANKERGGNLGGPDLSNSVDGCSACAVLMANMNTAAEVDSF